MQEAEGQGDTTAQLFENRGIGITYYFHELNSIVYNFHILHEQTLNDIAIFFLMEKICRSYFVNQCIYLLDEAPCTTVHSAYGHIEY